MRWIYALATIHVCWFIIFLFLLLFLCTPISEWWDIYDIQPGHCIDGNAFLVPEETINSSLDIAMMILSVGAVQKLITREHMKTKLAFIFVVGGLSGVIGFVKIGIVYGTPTTMDVRLPFPNIPHCELIKLQKQRKTTAMPSGIFFKWPQVYGAPVHRCTRPCDRWALLLDQCGFV